MQRRIGIRTPNRLDEGTDHVVVLITVSVVTQERSIYSERDVLRKNLHGRRSLTQTAERNRRGSIQRRKCTTSIARTETHQRCRGIWRNAKISRETVWRHKSCLHDAAQLFVGEEVESQQQRAREKRRDNAERRILGGSRNQRDPAVLDPGKKRVLLCLGKSMNLIEKQER